jgi:hypothetical protein
LLHTLYRDDGYNTLAKCVAHLCLEHISLSDISSLHTLNKVIA